MCDRPEARYFQEAYNRLPNPEDYYVIGACYNRSDIEVFWQFRDKMKFNFNISDESSLGKAYDQFGVNFVAINSDKIYTAFQTNQAGIEELEQFLLAAPNGLSFSSVEKKTFKISNYPNPFNGSTSVKFSLDKTEKCEISVFNSRGELVVDLLKSTLLQPGEHNYSLNVANQPSGIYFVRVRSGKNSLFHKITFIK